MKTVILINGKARSGKDTVASMFAKAFSSKGIYAKVFSFAKPMKEIISETFCITETALEEYKNKPEKFTVQILADDELILCETNFRKILQYFGTEAMKEVFGNNVWAKLAADNVFESDANVFICSDFRFNIEAEEFLKLASKYKIHVYFIKVESDMQTINQNAHISERDLDDFCFDYTLINNKGKLRETEERVGELAETLLYHSKIKN